jgi:iron complex outermembrane receptor protein
VGPNELFLPTATTAASSSLKTASLALFGQATFPLGNRTNITVGGRYTIDEKNYTNVSTTGVTTVLPERTYKSPTWRLAVDHELADDIMAYASYNRGFKSGMYGTGTVAPAVDPSYVDAYEVGLKTQFLDRRVTLNLATFYSKYKDMQISSVVINTNAGTSFIQLQNAASARSKGLEAELVARPTNNLRLAGSIALLDAEYTDFKNAPGFVFAPNNMGLVATVIDATGRRLNGAPSLSYTLSASYVVPTSVGDFRLEASDSYTSKYYILVDQLQASQARHLVGASISWTSPDERWDVRLWANNLLKERYYATIVSRRSQLSYTPGAPRTYGITATASF